MTVHWPWQVPIAPAFFKSNASASGGRTLTGDQFVTRTDAGFWRARASVIVRGEEAEVAYRALYAGLDGAAGQLLVPVYSRWRPRDYNGRMRSAAAESGIDGFSISDHGGLGFEEDPMMWTAALANRRATRIMVYRPNVPPIRPGHYFSIGERLYLVAREWSVETSEIVGGAYTFEGVTYTFDGDPYTFGNSEEVITNESIQAVDFWPPLRESVVAGTPLILGRPVCKMRFASDDTGVLDMGWSRSAEVAVEFEEVI